MPAPTEPVWCLVGNIDERGTRHFHPGAKVYCLPAIWGDGYERAQVFGRSRGGRWIVLITATKRITNWRAKLVYEPAVLRLFAEQHNKSAVALPWSREKAEDYVRFLSGREKALAERPGK